MGIVSALGCGVDSTFDALKAGRSGIGRIEHLETSHDDLPAGEVKMSNDQMCGLLGIEPSEDYTRTALLGAVALKEALESASLFDAGDCHMALVSGTTVGGMDKSEKYYMEFRDGDTNTQYIRTQDCGTTTEFAMRLFPFFDMATTSSTACSSAANAIIFAADLIRTGRYDRVVAGGSECISKFHLNGFNTLFILDGAPCRPFDATRAGLNLGEGAGYVVLESEASVARRGIRPLCRLAGYGNACDAFHQTASSPEGDGAFLSMSKALAESGLSPEEIDYVNAHGTGTQNNDLSEGKALERIFGVGNVPPVSSTKSFTGHTTSASGGIEAVISILAIQNDFLPVNLNFKERIEELSFTPVAGEVGHGEIRNVLSNSFGFGGNDTSLIFSKMEDER